jgi:cell wall-associated NlpC family hydrolase
LRPGGFSLKKVSRTGGESAFALFLFLLSCSPPGPRPFYSRSAGGWISPKDRDYSSVAPAAVIDRASFSGSESRLRKVAESYLGTPYRFGGLGHDGIDCSGFVRQVFREALGVSLPHNAAAMSGKGSGISQGNLKPGDLVFFKGFLFIDHVGIYMGGDYFIHSQTSVGVTYTRLGAPYFGSHFTGARRILD